jgi:hypothetical protein
LWAFLYVIIFTFAQKNHLRGFVLGAVGATFMMSMVVFLNRFLSKNHWWEFDEQGCFKCARPPRASEPLSRKLLFSWPEVMCVKPNSLNLSMSVYGAKIILKEKIIGLRRHIFIPINTDRFNEFLSISKQRGLIDDLNTK